jgi:hypothetical protein
LANVIPDTTTQKFANGTFDWDAGGQTYKVLLTTSSYTPSTAHDFANDVTNELSGTGYSRQTVANRTVTVDAINHRTDFGADNITWSAINTGTAPKYGVVIKDNGGADSANEIVWIIDLGTVAATNGGPLSIKWNNGVTAGTVWRMAAT